MPNIKKKKKLSRKGLWPQNHKYRVPVSQSQHLLLVLLLCLLGKQIITEAVLRQSLVLQSLHVVLC